MKPVAQKFIARRCEQPFSPRE